MRFFEIFLFLNANLVFAIAVNRRSPIDDFLKEVFVENSPRDFVNNASPMTSSDNETQQAEADALIDACRKNYDADYCFQTVLGPKLSKINQNSIFFGQ